MKKLSLIIAGMALAATTAGAQTILSEDFETGNKGNALHPITVGEGWTTVNGYKGTTTKYNWYNYYCDPNGQYTSATITGDCCAAVDAPFTYQEDGVGPREEILLTPELDLNDNYQLEFKFRVSPMNHSERSRYDLQVRVVTDDNLQGAETIFSILDEKMLRESGILTYPIDNWNVYTAKVGLADFKGEKVKLAFVFKMYTETANVAWLDDVVVSKYEPATGPVATTTLNRIDFGKPYIGEKYYSDVITLTNAGKDGLKITGFELPQGVETTLDAESINLSSFQSVDFRLSYTASLTSPAQGNVVIKTTGGDVTIAFTAAKQVVPENCTLELFNQSFPPAGWTNRGWLWSPYTLEGDHSVYCSGDYSASTLRSPRLDLSNGGKVQFTYFNEFDDDGFPEYDIELQVSYDGGDNWSTMWTSDYTKTNELLTAEVELPEGTDNSYVRWYYPAVETDDEGAYPHSTFILDRVLLPNLYGAGGAPLAATNPTPANNAADIYPKDINLSWNPALFADGYKLYVGTNAAADDLINGKDLGNVLTYTIPQCAYSTLYRWKVVPYNENGNCSTVTTWKFTTQDDATVDVFPYEENFDKGTLPTGWTMTPTADQYARIWQLNELHPYVSANGRYNVFYTMWLNAGLSNAMTTQEFKLPDDDAMQISFIWGDEHPADLVVDESGLVKKQNVEPNNGSSEIKFAILCDGEWTELSHISENSANGKKYWINEKIDLSAYKGKTVQFRWTHHSYSGRDEGGSLTHIVLERVLGDKAKVNMSTWNAGKVNYNKAKESGDLLTLLNQGANALTIKSVSFSTSNFTSSLKEGYVIEPDNGVKFSVRYDALTTAGTVEDDMTVEFASGYKVTFPVSGETLPETTYYYSFEPNEYEYVWDEDFTMIDVDNQPGYSFSSYWVHYSGDGLRTAFTLENDSKDNGMYGMMHPISGTHALVASSPQSSNADNWIISKQLKATAESKFEFYARNWESLISVLPMPKHNVEVLVSVAGNTSTSDFKTVQRKAEIPFLNDGDWQHYTVDLSSFAGQNVYVALRHTTDSPSNLAFFDDFCFHNFNLASAGVDYIEMDTENAIVEVYNIAGMKVVSGKGTGIVNSLKAGMYILRITDGNNTRVMKISKQ